MQEADAGVLGLVGIVGAGLGGIIEQLWRQLAAAIGHLEQQRAVAVSGIGGPQDHDVGGGCHLAVGATRREREVGDDGVAIVRRVEREGRTRGDALIGADIAKAAPCKGGLAREDVEADDFGE
ncbi:hypothetical protein ACVW0J_005232 [Bradyrhizobium sp. i1.7.7]